MDLEKEIMIQQFVHRRKIARALSLLSFLGLIAYATMADRFFPAEINGAYRNIYTFSVVAWVLLESALSKYIARTLSTCPVCGNIIPTVTDKQNRPKVGNGSLPDTCPYCRTDFSRFK